MEFSKTSIDFAKEIINQIYLFNSIFENYLQKQLENTTQSISINEVLPVELEAIIENIVKIDSQLGKLPNFTEFYNEHYINNNIKWTFDERDIKMLLPLAVHTFVNKMGIGKRDYYEYYLLFYKIWVNFSQEIIKQMFKDNKGVIIWKITTLVSILVNPNKEISPNLRRAISYPIPNEMYSLSKGIQLIVLEPKTKQIKKTHFNTLFVKQYLTSYTLLSSFKQILKEEIEVKVKRKTLRVIIEEYLNQDKIIIVREFPQNGLTLVDGSIIILLNKELDYLSLAIVLISLYYEMLNYLYWKVSITNFFKKVYDNDKDNIGKKIEQLLLGNYNTYHKESCYYIVDCNNYNNSPDTFRMELSAIENKYENKLIKDEVLYQLCRNDSAPSCLLTM